MKGQEEEKTSFIVRKVDKQKLVEEAAILREVISTFIKEETSSGVFIKLNWSAPRDASWVENML